MKFLPLLLLAQFAGMFPLFMYLVPAKVIGAGFFRFNMGLVTILLFVATFLALLQGVAEPLKFLLLGMGVASLVLLRLSWDQPQFGRALLHPLLIFWGFLLGWLVLSGQGPDVDWRHWVALGLGGAALAAALFAMVLGHQYLNVAGLPIRHLQRGTLLVFWVLSVRLAWLALVLGTSSVVLSHRVQPAYLLLGGMHGVLLWIGLLMGVAAPMAITWMALKAALIQSTQSATGLLYIVLIQVLMGTLIFDGYLLELNLPL